MFVTIARGHSIPATDINTGNQKIAPVMLCSKQDQINEWVLTRKNTVIGCLLHYSLMLEGRELFENRLSDNEIN